MEFLSLRVLVRIQSDYACNLLSTFPDIQFKEAVSIIVVIILPPPLPCPGTFQSSLPARAYSRPPPPGSLPSLPHHLRIAPGVQTAQAHELNYMLPKQNSCLPVLGCYLTPCLYFKM